MKIVQFIVVITSLTILISCPDYNNPIDPDAEDYQGWALLGEEEEGDPWSLSGINPEQAGWLSDLTPLIDWPDIDNAAQYEVQWALSELAVTGSTVYTVMTSEYQLASVLSAGNYVFWRIKAVNSSGGTSSWSDIFRFVVSPVIGENYSGGIVIYLSETGGLVAAVSDQSTDQVWIEGGATQTTKVENTSTEIGTGSANTDAIIAQSGHTGSAAQVCRDYSGGGFNDWFLPSKDELNLIYEQKEGIGNFSYYHYWSSSESEVFNNYPWAQWFEHGDQNPTSKPSPCSVRAIRAFSY